MKSMRRRRWRRIGLISAGTLVAAGIALYLALPVLVVPGIINAPNLHWRMDPAADPDAAALRRLEVTAHHRVSVGSPPVSLSVFVVDPPAETPLRGTILLFHGIRAGKEQVLGLARPLAGRGYRCVLPDLRGHGRSTGRYLTYGVADSQDAQGLLDWLAESGQLAPPVGVAGFSYGGAVALRLAAREPRIAAVAVVSTFSSLRDIARDFAARDIPLVGSLITQSQLDRSLRRAGRTAGFDPDLADNVRAAQATAAPILILHGTRDGLIPVAHARTLHAAAPDRSRLVIVEGEGHNSMLADRKKIVPAELAAWFAEHLRR